MRKRRNSLRSNSLRFFSPLSAPPLFRPQTKAGTISLCRDARSVRPKTNHLYTGFLIIPTQGVKEYMHELKVSSSVKKRTHEPCVPTRNNIALHWLQVWLPKCISPHNFSRFNPHDYHPPLRTLYNRKCRDARSVRPKNQPTIHWLLNHPHTRGQGIHAWNECIIVVKKRTHEPCVPTRNNIALHWLQVYQPECISPHNFSRFNTPRLPSPYTKPIQSQM